MISSQADQCNTELKDNTNAIADLKRQIQRLQSEITSAKSQVTDQDNTDSTIATDHVCI